MIISTSLSLPSSTSFHHHHNHRFSLLPKSTLTNSPPSTTTQATSKLTTKSAIIIGGGLAGLSAATHLHSCATPFILLESSGDIGCRVRTDSMERLPNLHHRLSRSSKASKLLFFKPPKIYSGARIFFNGGFYTVVFDSIQSLTNPIGTIFDKLLIGIVRIRVLLKSDDEIFVSDEAPVINLLRKSGFSDSIVDRFFRPFFGGIFFDCELETSSRMFNFIFKCLALGDNTLPEKGIGEIPKQLASKLPSDCIRLN